MKHSERIQSFVQEIWEWFAVHKRDLPWRDLTIKNDTERAYCIMVSEVMLQQTQVSRVVVLYKRFLERFPTLNDLAKASNSDVVLAWRGMGYNSRALRLRDAAKMIVVGSEKWKVDSGKFPQEMSELQSIPGIGYYTAAAIRNFAFYIPTPCVEVNIRRVLHTKFVGPQNVDGTWENDDSYLLKLAEEVLEVALRVRHSSARHLSLDERRVVKRRATSDWHAALMDYGALGLAKVKVNRNRKKEPGRFVGSIYIPNRIFRGKIVEELRDEPQGLRPSSIGRRVCIDWDNSEHMEWLIAILTKLEKDALITKKQSRYVLR